MRTRHPQLRRATLPRTGALLVALVPLMLGTACGGDDGDGVPGNGDGNGVEDGVEDGAVEADTVSSDPDCPATELSFTNRTAGLSGTATTALARSSADGGLYEVHVADVDLTADDLRSWRPDVSDDGNVITIQLTVFNASADPAPIEPGASLELTIEPDELTFLVRHFTADDDWSAAENIGVDSVGTLTVTAVGDTFCFDVDYRDQDKEVAGSVAAVVFERR